MQEDPGSGVGGEVESSPASVFSRSTESHNQDKVSMGTIAARDCLRILELTEAVASIVQLGLCQAADLRQGEVLPAACGKVYRAVRKSIGMVDQDRRQDDDIRAVLDLYHSGVLPVGEASEPAAREA